ncbi:hypothetical protein [Roseateles sp. LYH14W]|uniref:Glycosyltransferase RgtA/B/C/D-like domain-containing protein n=1 Tax=Pelomonas parva TaxID=3299032 RepID=A0ABW7EZQ3_9BURK
MSAMVRVGKSWAIVLTAIALVCVFALSLPVWQIHDDVYYSMIAQGWGIVSSPSADIPFMHPGVGMLAAGLTRVTGGPGYAIVIYTLLVVGLVTGLTAMIRLRVGQAVCFLFSVASLPLFLIPQYTVVAGYLALMALLLLASDGRRPAVIGALLLFFFSAALRVEMAILAIAVGAPFIFAAQRGKPGRHLQAITIGLGIGVAIGVAALSVAPMRSPALVTFDSAHAPLVPFVDYGLASIRQEKTNDPAIPPLDATERELLSQWFLADSSLFTPERLDAIAASVSWQDRIRSSRWKARDHVAHLHEFVYFWLLLAVVFMASFSARPIAILLSVTIFIGADLLFSCLGRPFPERVGLGLAVGVFSLTLVHVAQGAMRIRRAWIFAGVAILQLITLGCLYKEHYRAKDWDVEAVRGHLRLHAAEVVYFQTSHLPLQTLFKPLANEPTPVPLLVSLGGMFNHPARHIFEDAQGCTFAECLRSGRVIKIYASDTYLKMLARYALWKFGRPLEVLRSEEIGKVRFHEVRLVNPAAQ